MSDGLKRGLLDLINGGGIGAAGDKFEGGGLLSMIANAIATPYGSEDRMRDAMRPQRPMARPTGGLGNGSLNSVTPDPLYSGRGNVGMPMPESQMPLTGASDIPGGFNPASAAPVQPLSTGMTTAPSVAPDFTMPDGSSFNPPAPPSQAGQYNDVPTIHQYATSVGYPDNGMSQDQLIKSYVDSLGG